jgi:hypothetical protein
MIPENRETDSNMDKSRPNLPIQSREGGTNIVVITHQKPVPTRR